MTLCGSFPIFNLLPSSFRRLLGTHRDQSFTNSHKISMLGSILCFLISQNNFKSFIWHHALKTFDCCCVASLILECTGHHRVLLTMLFVIQSDVLHIFKRAIPGLFSCFQQLTVYMFIIIFSDNWIQTADLYHLKQPLCRLSHNHCPTFSTFCSNV